MPLVKEMESSDPQHFRNRSTDLTKRVVWNYSSSLFSSKLVETKTNKRDKKELN